MNSSYQKSKSRPASVKRSSVKPKSTTQIAFEIYTERQSTIEANLFDAVGTRGSNVSWLLEKNGWFRSAHIRVREFASGIIRFTNDFYESDRLKKTWPFKHFPESPLSVFELTVCSDEITWDFIETLIQFTDAHATRQLDGFVWPLFGKEPGWYKYSWSKKAKAANEARIAELESRRFKRVRTIPQA